MELNVTDLVLEVTRRCNMRCEHCLRGAAQRKNVDTRVIDAVIDQIDYIGNVTFTGGEPTLNVPALQYFAERLRKAEKKIGSFYIVTNGKVVPREFLLAVMDLFTMTDGMDPADGIGGLTVSGDQFHYDRSPDVDMYKAFSFYRPEDKGREIPYQGIINEGRAKRNGLGRRSEDVPEWDFDGEEDYISVNNLVYVSVRGDVITNCDLSFSRIDREKHFNLLETPIVDYLKSISVEEAA